MLTRLDRASTTPGGHRSHCGRGIAASSHAAGFTLLDLLVSISVIAVLISIMTPALAGVTEAARRVRCASNLRQIGLGLFMYAEHHDGMLPASVFSRPENARRALEPSSMMLLHVGENDPNNWDGLGLLVDDEFISATSVFYCPSHTGNHAEEAYEGDWTSLGAQIVGNYHYRPSTRTDGIALEALAKNALLATDGLRTLPDYNHRVGLNGLQTDGSVTWRDDSDRYIARNLPLNDSGRHSGGGIRGLWYTLDTGERRPEGGHEDGPFDGDLRLGARQPSEPTISVDAFGNF